MCFISCCFFAGSRIVWVENSQTGELIPLARRTNPSASRRGRRSGSSLNQAGSTEVDVAGNGNDEDDALLDLEQGATGSADPYSNLQLTVPPLPPPLDESLDPRTGKVLRSSVLGASGAVAQALQKQEEEIAPIVRYHNLVMVQRATYLVFQVNYISPIFSYTLQRTWCASYDRISCCIGTSGWF